MLERRGSVLGFRGTKHILYTAYLKWQNKGEVRPIPTGRLGPPARNTNSLEPYGRGKAAISAMSNRRKEDTPGIFGGVARRCHFQTGLKRLQIASMVQSRPHCQGGNRKKESKKGITGGILHRKLDAYDEARRVR